LHLFVRNSGSAGVSGHWTGGNIRFAVGSKPFLPTGLFILIKYSLSFFDDDQEKYSITHA